MDTRVAFDRVRQVGSKRGVLLLILDKLALRRERDLFEGFRVFKTLTVEAISLDQDVANLLETFEWAQHGRYSTGTHYKTLAPFVPDVPSGTVDRLWRKLQPVRLSSTIRR